MGIGDNASAQRLSIYTKSPKVGLKGKLLRKKCKTSRNILVV